MDRPNVLLIVADQWRGDCLGSLGRHPVLTPHLDQLADEGLRFGQAWADAPICMAQRVTLLTGQVAARFGCPGNWGAGKGPAIDRRATLPALLRDQCGYQTRAVGKMHFEPARARHGFDHVCLHPNDYVNWLEGTPWAGTYRGHGLGGNEVAPVVAAHPEPFTHTHWIVDQALDFCQQREPDVPFFMQMIFEAPHAPFDPPAEVLRLYDHIAIPDPVQGGWTVQRPSAMEAGRISGKLDRLDPAWVREARRHYYAQCTHIDHQLGRLFGELNKRGWWQDTLVIFTADHGECLGDHGLFHKSNFLNASARVPLIVKPPRGLPNQRLECSEAVMTADLMPTILATCGATTTAPVDGRNLLPALEGQTVGDGRLCGECGPYAFATDGAHKLCWYRHGGVAQLFDVRQDPDDLHDLAAARPTVVEALTAQLAAWFTRHGRPHVQDGALVVEAPVDLDPLVLRRRNHAACRGPLRHGAGY